MLRSDVGQPRFGRLLIIACSVLILTACATSRSDPLEVRLAAMSDADLVSYYEGINERIKAIQAGTRADDRQRTVLQQDHLARMPYITGGEAWRLEQKRTKVHKEMEQRGLHP